MHLPSSRRIMVALSLAALSLSLPGLAATTSTGKRSRSSPRRPTHRPPAFVHHAPPMRAPRFAPRPARPAPQRAYQPGRAPRAQQPSRPQAQLQRPAVSQPRAGAVRPHFFHPPKQDDHGRPIAGRPVRDLTAHAPLLQHSIENAKVTYNVRAVMASPGDRDGKFHWYNADGMRYAHWYDATHDRHWFGFYRGNAYLWAIYWNNYYWWQEPASGRWLVFWRNHWWWHGSSGPAYVYVGDQYYLWNQSPGGVVLVQAQPPAVVAPPDTSAQPQQGGAQPLGISPPEQAAPAQSEQPAPEAAPQPAETTPAQGTMSLTPSFPPEYHYSADGTRMIQVEGEDRAAYLYDVTKKDDGGENELIRYMDQGVSGVRFTDTSKGSALQIILTTRDSNDKIHHMAYDAQGNPLGNAVSAQLTAPPEENPMEKQPPVDMPPSEAPMPDGV